MKHAKKHIKRRASDSEFGSANNAPFGSEFDDFGSGPGPRGRGGRGHHRGHGPHGHGPRGRGRRGGRRRPRVSRGDVRLGVLAVLNDEPMHGYQIMQELEERSGGGWKPSPGSIYPTLQQLADEGLIVSQPVDGKNVFSLTEAGATAVQAAEGPPPWERFADESGAPYANLKRSMFQLGAAARQVAAAGTQSQVAEANKVLGDARKALYRILAEDDHDVDHPGSSTP